MADIDLRAYVFLDSLQPQYAAFLGTVAQGFLPLGGDSSLYVEISPGIEINRLTDVAMKSHHVRPGMQIVQIIFIIWLAPDRIGVPCRLRQRVPVIGGTADVEIIAGCRSCQWIGSRQLPAVMSHPR